MPEIPARSTGQHFFLQRKFHFYLTLAVIVTTLFSWFNFNSCLIMLLVACRLLDGKPAAALKAAFSNKYFLAWFAVFLLDLAGLAYTHHFFTGWRYVESKATLVAIPFVLCGGPFADRMTLNRFLSAYCGLLFLICLFCLAMAVRLYMHSQDPLVFFYHALVSPLANNAVFFSAYTITALLFLLSSPLDFGTGLPGKWLPPSRLRYMRTGLILFFILVIVLLSSKLLLVLTIIILIAFLYKKSSYHSGLIRRPIILLGIAAVIGTGLLALTDNPVKERYKEIAQGDIGLYRNQQKIPPFTVYNGVSLRLLIWRSAFEILNEQKAWVYGVTAGDAQDLLNQKYFTEINSGFINYNFHNEYIEILVRSGVVGFFIFLAACSALILLARSAGTKEAWFTVALVLLLCLTESMLETQHSAFFCCFFPLLYLPQQHAQ